MVVSAVKKHMWYTMCYLLEPLNCCFQSLVSLYITTGLISIKFTYFMPPYTQPNNIPHLKEIDSVVCKICAPEYCPIFSHFSFCTFLKIILTQLKTIFSWIDFFQFGTPIRHFVTFLIEIKIWRCLN